ncbi:MAG: zf-HC2 domain-containing protein [candidate division KSB1 bacterium]|nr:zf-HC2 domain-containing protein [candidate division KSB1 bacterium]MDZ7276519.1 zf-HC2 domain-containing protein [candidate division KSB1 bacterium]MDZ7286700.1 zf-HC2 domain-containing protein [candidate division KSB1 bacterium]MDZ7300289.1 zf-HC2 domain-containing protein [candidate division KSB1 bacterium]MDZ7307890.1 zf-HC2 domain-containing protein [candidate division KSB1 bacterium]
MTLQCEQVIAKAAAFIDRELDETTAAAVAEHIAKCPHCAHEVRQQREMKLLVQQHARRLTAPAALRARLQQALADYPTRYSFGGQVRQLFRWQPVPALATLVVLLLLPAVLVYFAMRTPARVDVSRFPAIEASFEGEIICIDCLLLDALQIVHGHDASHRCGLRTAEGGIVTLIAHDKGNELMQQAATRHNQRVLVHGRLLPKQAYLQVRDFSML